MIRIEHISFDFTAPDEDFAHRLYADWDSFRRDCVEQVIDGCLAEFGKDRSMHETDRIDLDLGRIPEKDFYREFPKRLREELLKNITQWNSHDTQTGGLDVSRRSGNLLYYMEYGCPLTEWTDTDFSLEAELEWLSGQPETVSRPAIEKLALLCLKREYALRRLLWQTTNEHILLQVFSPALVEPSAGNKEKQRFLALLLEVNPGIPLRFVHETHDDARLREMSVLLDTLSVRQLIRTETKEHAEVDLPPYWHYLYEWLIKYYPYNGIAMFGGKAEFTRHLHYRLLTFIHKRNGAPYLSKAELTVSFLLEVFGPACYRDVLNAIYLLQPHNPDGSPVYDHYFNRELYRMFLRLSLLRLPEAAHDGAATDESQEITKEIQWQGEPGAVTALLTDMEGLAAILKDPAWSDDYKRMLWTMLVREQPEAVIRWFQSAYAKDNALLHLLAELAEDATVNRLLAAYSLATLDRMTALRKYMETHRDGISWLKEIPDPRRASAFRLSALHLLASGTPGEADNVKNILRLIYRKVTDGDKNEDAAVDALARELGEAGFQTAFHETDEITGKNNEDLQDLYRMIYDPNLSEAYRRRAVASYWDNHRENPVKAVRLLQERNMLDEVMELTGSYAWENILHRTLHQAAGTEKASALMPLFRWLTAHETSLSSYRADNGHSLRTGLLLGIVRLWQDRRQDKPLKSTVRFLLVSLFREDCIPIIRKQSVLETALETAGVSDAEQAFALSDAAFNGESSELLSLYHTWLHGREDASNVLQTLSEHRWNTAEGFAEWLEDTSVSLTVKREQLREAVRDKPQAWLQLLRTLPQESRASASLETLMTTQDMLQAVAKVNFYQATVLSRVMEKLRHTANHLPLPLIQSHIPLERLLRKALLAYLQDPETSGRTRSEKEITDAFLRYLRLSVTGKEQDDTDAIEWRQLAETMTNAHSDADSPSKENLLNALSDPSATHAVLRQTLDRLMDKHPETLRTWLEQEAGNDSLTRMAEAVDYIQTTHWADDLTRTPGFAHPDAFRRLTGWLLQRIPLKELATALFLYVKEPGWQKFTPEQMEMYFFSRLYGSTDSTPVMETLTDGSRPEETRKWLFRRLLHHHPGKLSAFIRESVLRNTLPLGKWLEWTDTTDWLELITGISLAKAELLRQVTDSLSLPEEERKKALATYIIYADMEEWLYATPQETVRDFIGMLPSLKETDAAKKEETVRSVEAELALPETETPAEEGQPEVLTVGNAGLCLSAPWFVRLFAMLGWLDEEKKKFRGTASKVRAVFLLQYIACGEEREWREAELAFNRLLTALPGHVPLPKRLSLTDGERQTADSMVSGIKANWPQMKGTSVEGFRKSFIAREGRLEQKDEYWQLTVSGKAYDILLETVPWGFRQIRLPWLKKYVQVSWHGKQEF